MDEFGDEETQVVVDFIMENDYHTTQDLDGDTIDSLDISDKLKYSLKNDNSSLYLPDVLDRLQSLPESGIICGGSEFECLLEIEILMSSIGKKYKRNNDFIYS